jgi:hypothetical protein
MISLRHEKCFLDDGITEGGVVSRVNIDAGDMCVRAVSAAQRAASAESAI